MKENSETKAPMVSVVVPVYNVGPWLAECLDSLIGQSLREIEIICVDDGSTDDSLKILQEYADRDSRIQIIKLDHTGVSEARNTGMRAAQGKYIYLMDGDDILEAEALELCVSDMEARDLEYLCFNAVAFEEEPEMKEITDNLFNRVYLNRNLNEEKIYTGRELFHELKEMDRVVATVWSGLILRSAVFDHELWFHHGMMHEDESWVFEMHMSLSRCGCLNKQLYRYRIRSDSAMRSTLYFGHVHGLFAAACKARSFLAEHPELLEDKDLSAVEIEHAVLLQKRSVYRYRIVTEEERQKRMDLSPEERVLFEQMIVYPASLQDEIAKRTQERNALKEKNDKLSRQNAALKKDKAKLKGKVKKLKESRSYQIGRAITWLPRKIKALFRKLQTKS